MSLFGSTSNDRGRSAQSQGFFQTHDHFAGVARHRREGEDDDDDDDDALNFEDTYDGLGDKLGDEDDVLNDETFGAEDSTIKRDGGADFDFFGQTAKVSNAIDEEQLRYVRQQPPPKSVETSKPARTGYERYNDPEYIPDLQASASLWGVAPKKADERAENLQHRPTSPLTSINRDSLPKKKIMSLEEVEADLRAQSKKTQATSIPVSAPEPTWQPIRQEYPPHNLNVLPAQNQASGINLQYQPANPYPQHHPAFMNYGVRQPVSQEQPYFPQMVVGQQGFGFDPQLPNLHQSTAATLPSSLHRASPQPPRQNTHTVGLPPNRAGQGYVGQPPTPFRAFSGQPTPNLPPGMTLHSGLVTHPQQLLHLSEQEREAFLIEDAKRAKRNHKIFLLSQDNGLMTPQDKNFITRIQLQQLVTATGSSGGPGSDDVLAEDFYYQVHSQIRGGPRQNPQQPLSNFAQTYLFQTGGRTGASGRRANRHGDTHMQRMEQQVQRAVEAAKAKPKNKQLVIEGSLGKISFSNAKTPKPLLNIRRPDSAELSNRPAASGNRPNDGKRPAVVVSTDKKSTLRNIERVYDTLMAMEDHERHSPPPPTSHSDSSEVETHMEWTHAMHNLNDKLWKELKVLEPIVPDSPNAHPFIAFLGFAKGKKLMPRVFRHTDEQQRLTILTIIIVYLGSLDVVRLGHLQAGEQQIPAKVREEIELFSQTVMPSLFGFITETKLQFITGLLSLALSQLNVYEVGRSKVGLSFLTTLVSRGELIKQSGDQSGGAFDHWTTQYNSLFDAIEPYLGHLFPGSVNSGEDMYVWQFLAALGVGANAEQQQRLVMGVKDRVMETVTQSKTLPPEMSAQKLGNVNLFMRSIGLDVELLD
ncbi:MAG: hypothetical protein M1829_004373 [Trizodia sp. TS-e1964]|nr:MAG: hypothetical protein M1829_004373 [Trizodia sp. TS-e1964]